MVFRKRVIAPLAFAWTLTAAGLAAVAFDRFAPLRCRAPEVIVEDVQIGERGNQSRIAFLCSAECTLEPYGDEFMLKAVAASFDVSLADRSERIRRVRAMPDAHRRGHFGFRESPC